jgi:hypothetical protein
MDDMPREKALAFGSQKCLKLRFLFGRAAGRRLLACQAKRYWLLAAENIRSFAFCSALGKKAVRLD